MLERTSMRELQIPWSENGHSKEGASELNPQWLAFLILFSFGFGHLVSAVLILLSAPLFLLTLMPLALPSHSITALLRAMGQRCLYPRGPLLHRLGHSWPFSSQQFSALAPPL